MKLRFERKTRYFSVDEAIVSDGASEPKRLRLDGNYQFITISTTEPVPRGSAVFVVVNGCPYMFGSCLPNMNPTESAAFMSAAHRLITLRGARSGVEVPVHTRTLGDAILEAERREFQEQFASYVDG